MIAVEASTFTLPREPGFETFVYRWQAVGAPKASIVIAHGVSEHGARYDRLARALAAAGFRVYAPDHRGHGRSAREGRIGDAGAAGWVRIIEDVHAVLECAKAETPDVPAFVLGHSMGAIVVQRFLALHGSDVSGAILSGTPTSFLGHDDLIAAATAAGQSAPQEPSAMFGAMFAGFNAPFEQVTGFEWLSRDAAEVGRYVDDPLSGNPLTNATLADFLPGWALASSEETRARVPRELPILVISGERDAAGSDGAAPRELAAAYRAHGITDVELRLYPGARHEIFNETNRDDVTADLIAWLDARVARGAPIGPLRNG